MAKKTKPNNNNAHKYLFIARAQPPLQFVQRFENERMIIWNKSIDKILKRNFVLNTMTAVSFVRRLSLQNNFIIHSHIGQHEYEWASFSHVSANQNIWICLCEILTSIAYHLSHSYQASVCICLASISVVHSFRSEMNFIILLFFDQGFNSNTIIHEIAWQWKRVSFSSFIVHHRSSSFILIWSPLIVWYRTHSHTRSMHHCTNWNGWKCDKMRHKCVMQYTQHIAFIVNFIFNQRKQTHTRTCAH